MSIIKETDVLVIGAGPSGTSAASTLLAQGFSVIIVEKTTFPRFVIGESLLPKCMDALEEAGLMEAVNKANFQKKFGAEFIMGDDTCDFKFAEQYTQGWDWTWQVPRADFDKVLADEVEKKGAIINYNCSVKDIDFTDDVVCAQIESQDEEYQVRAKYVVDASGYGRVLPNLLDLNVPSDFPERTALFAHVTGEKRDSLDDEKRIQVVILSKDIWVWIIPLSDEVTSLGVVGDLSTEKNLNSSEELREYLTKHPALIRRFGGCEFVFEPKRITAYSSGVKKLYGDRFVLTGNSTEFLDPIFSSGVTFALESGVLSGKLIGKELNGEEVDWENDYENYLRVGVDVFRSYVEGWYDGTLLRIFFAKLLNQNIKNQICSVLAGYVWDMSNPYVKKHAKALKVLDKVIGFEEKRTSK